MYITEGGYLGSQKIRKISPSGDVTTFAGSGNVGSSDGNGSIASFKYPYGIAIDPNGNLFIADTGNNKIRKITPSGVVTTLAGSGSYSSSDGNGTSASIFYPHGIAIDNNGNLFVTEEQSHKIRKITPSGVATTFAGSGSAGSSDGIGTAASFNLPMGITIDSSGNLFVADSNNFSIRKITPSGLVTTVAGGSYGYTDGVGSAANFYHPTGITIDSGDNLFVTDAGNHNIRKITPSGVVTTVVGSYASGRSGGSYADGQGIDARLNNPYGVVVDQAGNLFVADTGNLRIRKITISANATPTLTISTSKTSANTTDSITFTATATDPDGTIASYAWNFGDGTTSATQNPSHTYTSAGQYTVSCTVTDSSGATATQTASITVSRLDTPPTANFTATPISGNAPMTVSFINSSMDAEGNITSSWDFGDGTTSTEKNPSKTFGTAGSYTVKLTVTDNKGASTSTTQTITVANIEKYSVYVTTAGGGGICMSQTKNPNGIGTDAPPCPPLGSGSPSQRIDNIAAGSEVTVIAYIPSNSKFTGWSGDATGTDRPLKIIVDKSKNITANFATAQSYSLKTASNNTAYGTVSSNLYVSSYSTSFQEGTTVTLTATPISASYEFTGWSGDAMGTQNPLTVTMDKAKTITANFAKAAIYTLTITQPSNGTIKVTPQKEKYADGETVTLEAVGNSGYMFSSWSGDASGYSEKTTMTIYGNKTVSAKFTYDNTPPSITIASPKAYTTVTGSAYKIIADVKKSNGMPSVYIDGVKKGVMSVYSDSFVYELDTCRMAAGSHTLKISATSVNGNLGTAQSSFSVEGCSNVLTPSVVILDPANNDTLTSVATIRTDIQNIDQIKKAVLYVDGRPYGTVATAAPFNFKIQTSALQNGTHTVKIKVTTLTGKLFESNAITVKTENDIWQENVAAAILSPKGDDARAQKFNVTVGSSGGEKITNLSLFVDDREDALATSKTVGDEVVLSVDMSTYSDGTHTLKAFVETENGVAGYTPSVRFTLKKNCTDYACDLPSAPEMSTHFQTNGFLLSA